MLEYDTLKYAPSELAAAAMLVALGHQEAAPAAAAHLSAALSAFSPMLERYCAVLAAPKSVAVGHAACFIITSASLCCCCIIGVQCLLS